MEMLYYAVLIPRAILPLEMFLIIAFLILLEVKTIYTQLMNLGIIVAIMSYVAFVHIRIGG